MTPLLPPRRSRREAYTLVEMLIVVTIMIMLVAVTLPVAKKTMEGSQGREATRELHAYFELAKSRALQTGRPYGVFFPFPEPPLGQPDPILANNSQYATYWPVRQVNQVFMAEIPAYYSGSTTLAGGKIDGTGTRLLVWNIVAAPGPNGWVADTTEADYLTALLNIGEQFLIRFNNRGEWYICTNLGNRIFRYDRPLYQNSTQPIYPHGAGNPNALGVSFQIARSPQPVGSPLELPRGTCIDMTYSGVGNTERQFTIPASVNSRLTGLTVLFAPGGAIDSMYMDTQNALRIPMDDPTGSLYFLIGKVENVGDPYDLSANLYNPAIYAKIETSNLADPNSLWVTVSRGTGRVATADNMPDPSLTGVNIRPYIRAAREAAILGEQRGGQ